MWTPLDSRLRGDDGGRDCRLMIGDWGLRMRVGLPGGFPARGDDVRWRLVGDAEVVHAGVEGVLGFDEGAF